MKLANTIVYFLSLLMLLSNTSFADNSFKKEIKHTYSAAEYDQLKLSNQFGEIQIITKDIPTINIRVVIRIDASDLDEANRLFRYIQIIHTDESRVLDYKTQLESSFNKKKFEINYYIELPKNIQLKVYNKFGNIYANDLVGSPQFEIEYGSLRIDKLTNEKDMKRAKVTLSYSNATLTSLKWLDVDMRYSQLSIDEAQALSIYSKYSKVSIGKVSSVVSVSKYDVPYSIGTINNLKVNSSYSTFQIEKLNRKLMAIMRYSECKVTQVSNQFSLLELDLQYGGAQIPIPYELSYTIEATAQYGEIQIPDATRVRTTQSNTSQNFQGVVGSASGTNCNVRIESRYSNIDLESN